MKFLEHIKKIDTILEELKESEYQKTLFSSAGNVSVGIGMGMTSTRPNIYGGVNIFDDGRQTGYTKPNIFGGQDIN